MSETPLNNIQPEAEPAVAPHIIVAGVGRDGSSIVQKFKLPAIAGKLYVTASPVQAVSKSPDLVRISSGSDAWCEDFAARMADVKLVIVITATNCREAQFTAKVLQAAQGKGALAVAMLVEPLLTGAPHRVDAAQELHRNIMKQADSTILALSNLHPPSSLPINEAMEAWTREIFNCVNALVAAASVEDAIGLDFHDVAGVLSQHCRATVGSGSGASVEDAIRCAFANSLALEQELETASVAVAQLIIGSNMPVDDARRANGVLEQIFPKAQVTSGVSVREGFQGVAATIIAGKIDTEIAHNATRKLSVESSTQMFKHGDPTMYDGENLDIPAYLRKGVVLPGGLPRVVPEQGSLFEPKPAPKEAESPSA